MSQPVDLLLITWNRREYVEKMLPTLLNDPSDFHLYCWDNGSKDGTADIIRDLCDIRVKEKHFHPENVGQTQPCQWFFEKATSDVIGKVDDDILLPTGWINRIAPMIRKEPKFGMLGCWIFMPEDWNESLAQKNIIEISDELIFRTTSIAGQSFLARKEYLIRYQKLDSPGLPVNRLQMCFDGLIHGYPIPLLYAHNMDDPRSSMNTKTQGDSLQEHSAFTARRIGFQSPKDYTKWIMEDAYKYQKYTFEHQLWWLKLQADRSLMGKIKYKLLSPFRPK